MKNEFFWHNQLQLGFVTKAESDKGHQLVSFEWANYKHFLSFLQLKEVIFLDDIWKKKS